MYFKRHFYNQREYFLDRKSKKVFLLKEFHQRLQQKKLWNRFGFKKITGSFVGDVLETNSFKSPFRAFLKICWLDMPILDKKYIEAGKSIEPKVLQLIKKQKKVEEIITFPAKKYNYDFFKNKDDIVGGLPDGLIKPQNIVVEIKTTNIKNLTYWENKGVPEEYLKQTQIYTYLMELKQYLIVATFLEEEDYLQPDSYPINQRKTRVWGYTLDQAKVKDDITKLKAFHQQHIKSGISPIYDENRDKDLVEYLMCENDQQWKTLQTKWVKEGKINLTFLNC